MTRVASSREPFIFDDRLPEGLPVPELTENARIVLAKRYLKKDQTGEPVEKPEVMFWRVAYTIAREDGEHGASEAAVEEVARQFYDLMINGKFEPNSPTLMNAGRPLGQLSACFVLPVDDSLSNGKSGIYDTLKSMALVHQSGGGTGFSFSRLRPTGDTVNSTMGVASGPVSFMTLYDSSTEVVKQGGTRRGANMGILRVDHPDIREFISCKDDTSRITNFNISVAVTDAFMEAVEKGEPYDLLSPRTREVLGQENAREIFDMIVQGAWKTGEPGVFFIDRANEANPVPHLGSYEATNPCVTGDTWVHTTRGPRQVRELIAVPFEARIQGAEYRSGEEGFFSTGRKKVFRLRTAEGYELRATEDHPIRRAAVRTRYRIQEEWCPVRELNEGDWVLLDDHRAHQAWEGWGTREEGYLLGLLLGDGTLKQDAAVLSVWEPAAVVNGGPEPVRSGIQAVMAEAECCARTLPHSADFRGWTSVPGRGEYRMKLSAIRDLALSLGMGGGEKRKEVTPRVEKGSSELYRGLFRGLFDADGSVQGSQDRGVSVRLAQSDLPMLKAVQRMLLRLGIVSTVYRNRRDAGSPFLPDGKGGRARYSTLPQHELVISNDNLFVFRNLIGFADERKAGHLDILLTAYQREPNREGFLARVASITPDGEEEVYDVQVPGVNAFDANGLVVHNCGEQPLLPYDVCNLGSVNLGQFVREDFVWGEDPAEGVDWDALRQVIHLSTHFLDNVIDANRYPLDEITDLAQRIRRVGLGVMGWADMLVRLGIPYNSDEGVEMGRRVMKFLNEEARVASEKLAETRGVFPEWELSIWGPDHKAARNADGERIQPERKLRNCNLTTVAPTGTISIFAGCSGGIEPLFAVAFMRNQAGSVMPDVNPDFVRFAQDQGWYSEELMERIASEGHIHFEEIPEEIQRVFVTAHDISPEWHVRMQGAFQEHTDSAISKTTNFSQEATREHVREIYELAFRLGAKGVTVYRDGSRPEQVLSTGKTGKGAESEEAEAHRRELEQEVADAREENHRLHGELEKLRAELEDRDRTAAAARRKRQRPAMLRGRTMKMNSPLGDIYVTINEDDRGRPFEVFCTLGKAGGAAFADAEAMGRLMSLALRSGVPISSIRDQLRGISSDRAVGVGPNKVLSAPDAIGQAIERYLEEQAGIQEELPMDAPAAAGVKTRAAPARYTGTREHFMGSCPDCGAGQLAYEEGCVKCHICGYSECG